MNRQILSLAIFTVACLMIVEVCNAQLINYKRRKGGGGAAAAPAPATTTAVVPSIAWKTTPPKATTAEEKKYDVNRDGKLQVSEVKSFLQGVVDEVNSKGRISVNSDILKPYDRNADGAISRYEISAIQTDLQ